ncbi:hypothetical protein HDU83_006994 [Entophlyctis luteolus]|nr:hypothetical protein HDU83_006994 [Entophlyctis luteolus]
MKCLNSLLLDDVLHTPRRLIGRAVRCVLQTRPADNWRLKWLSGTVQFISGPLHRRSPPATDIQCTNSGNGEHLRLCRRRVEAFFTVCGAITDAWPITSTLQRGLNNADSSGSNEKGDDYPMPKHCPQGMASELQQDKDTVQYATEAAAPRAAAPDDDTVADASGEASLFLQNPKPESACTGRAALDPEMHQQAPMQSVPGADPSFPLPKVNTRSEDEALAVDTSCVEAAEHSVDAAVASAAERPAARAAEDFLEQHPESKRVAGDMKTRRRKLEVPTALKFIEAHLGRQQRKDTSQKIASACEEDRGCSKTTTKLMEIHAARVYGASNGGGMVGFSSRARLLTHCNRTDTKTRTVGERPEARAECAECAEFHVDSEECLMRKLPCQSVRADNPLRDPPQARTHARTVPCAWQPRVWFCNGAGVPPKAQMGGKRIGFVAIITRIQSATHRTNPTTPSADTTILSLAHMHAVDVLSLPRLFAALAAAMVFLFPRAVHAVSSLCEDATNAKADVVRLLSRSPASLAEFCTVNCSRVAACALAGHCWQVVVLPCKCWTVMLAGATDIWVGTTHLATRAASAPADTLVRSLFRVGEVLAAEAERLVFDAWQHDALAFASAILHAHEAAQATRAPVTASAARVLSQFRLTVPLIPSVLQPQLANTATDSQACNLDVDADDTLRNAREAMVAPAQAAAIEAPEPRSRLAELERSILQMREQVQTLEAKNAEQAGENAVMLSMLQFYVVRGKCAQLAENKGLIREIDAAGGGSILQPLRQSAKASISTATDFLLGKVESSIASKRRKVRRGCNALDVVREVSVVLEVVDSFGDCSDCEKARWLYEILRVEGNIVAPGDVVEFFVEAAKLGGRLDFLKAVLDLFGEGACAEAGISLDYEMLEALAAESTGI